MLDIKYIRENTEEIKEALEKRGVKVDVERLLALDGERRKKTAEADALRAEQNKNAEAAARASGHEKDELIARGKELKTRLVSLEAELEKTASESEALLYAIPNIPAPEVSAGGEEANKVVREGGEKPQFDFQPKNYLELGEALDLIDTERAARISGARFAYLKHEAVLLEFALVQFVFARLTNEEWLSRVVKDAGLSVAAKPFIPVLPPVMIRKEAFRAMGKLDPGQEEERYHLPKDELYLVGSAEHSVGPMHLGEVLREEQLPHRHIAFSTCFRREAGSYGKDTRGIMRVHQFDKLEMFSFAHPDSSNEEHGFFLSLQEAMMRELGLPYRAVLIAAGDMVSTDTKQYDIEAWLPGTGEYRETHSTSNSTDFQARRLGTKFKGKDGKTRLVHTINGTAFAIPRALIAILENYQQADGSVKVPEALVPYMSGISVIRR